MAPVGFSFAPVALCRLGTDPIFARRGRRERFLKRIESEHMLMGWHDEDGRVVSYIWFSRALAVPQAVPFRYGLNLLLAPGQAYVWDCATDAAAQGQGFYRNALRQARHLAYAEGCTDVFIYTEIDNVASARGILAAGFAERLHHRMSRFGPLRRIVSEGSPTRWYLGAATPCFLSDLAQQRMAG